MEKAHRANLELATTLARVVMLCILALGVSVTQSAAETCLDQVERVAADYNLSTDPPRADGDDELLSTEELDESGGVIEPPETHDPAVIEPPESPGYGMPTVPDVTPAPERQGDAEPEELSASDLVILEAILVSARAEAERGQEEDCFERLQAAQRFIAGQATEAP